MGSGPPLRLSLAARVCAAGWVLLADLVCQLAAAFAAAETAGPTSPSPTWQRALRRRLRLAEALARRLVFILAARVTPAGLSAPLRTPRPRPGTGGRTAGFRLIAAMPRVADRLPAPRIPPRISVAGFDTAPRPVAGAAAERAMRQLRERIAVLQRLVARPQPVAARLARRLARPAALRRFRAFQWPRLPAAQARTLAQAASALPADPETLARDLWRPAPG